MSTKPQHFELWICRSDAAHSPYALKFEVHAGRGLLRVWRASGELSQPATKMGEIQLLDQRELLQSRFVHVDKARNEYAFTPNFADRLATLPEGTWVKLLTGEDRHLRLPDLAAEIILQRRSRSWSPPEESTPRPAKQEPSRRLSDHGKRQTAADRIIDLEAQLTASRSQITKLKQRVAGLESQIEALGGETTPLVLD